MGTREKLLIISLFFLITCTGIIAVFPLLVTPIGPGLPDSINGWYFPTPDGYYSNGTRMFSDTGSEHFGRIGDVSKTCPSQFPMISPDCRVAQFVRFDRNYSPLEGRYIVISWFFNRTTDFETAEQVLYQSLKETGPVSPLDLEISSELSRRSGIAGENETLSGSTRIPVTRYISPATSGYFLVYELPLFQDREDYLIMYYGILGPDDLAVHSRFLTVLIAEGGLPAPEKIGNLMRPSNSLTTGPTISPTETGLVCETPPSRPLYLLENSDKTRTHQFRVIVQDSSNRTLCEESFRLGPGESYLSIYKTATINMTQYYLTFIIDGNATYSQTIYDSATNDYSFEYNPSNKDRLTYFPWMTDYGCRPVTPTP